MGGSVHRHYGGDLLVGGGARLNQYAERVFDALMHRTKLGRFQESFPERRLLFGLILEVAIWHPSAFTSPLATTLAGVTIASYLLLYTPLKRKTHLATAIGGIPGAMPPVIGWVAITGSLSIETYILFLVLFLWQIPHSLALGWMYRTDYIRGGYRLLPAMDPTGAVTSRVILLFVLTLIPASVLPYAAGMAGFVSLLGVVGAGIVFLGPALSFARVVSDKGARALFLASFHASVFFHWIVDAFTVPLKHDR
jgi:protoheme IX farnesyltransferase